jgi:hypothetical protein
MHIVLLLSLIVILPVYASGQTPTPTPPPTQPAPPKTQPRPARPASRTMIVTTVTDPKGATLPGIHVEVLGASDRSGDTNDSGTLQLANMKPGTYRLRYSGDTVITFEREVTVRAGQVADVDVVLNAAPEESAAQPPMPEPAPAPVPVGTVGPLGEPIVVPSIPDLIEKNYIGRQPRKETALGCSGNARTTIIQLNEPQPERLYENAESAYYVIAGEGTVRLNGRESALTAGGFALVPRGTAHGLVRRGRTPLVLLAVLSGEPCSAQ